ncbi:MAG: TldD/PmbA family protein [Myxococcales bacterium]|nr:TldD/PmbA family protein [Myxococcales bacterium]
MRAIATAFLTSLPAGGHVSLRLSRERSETIRVRQSVVEPVVRDDDFGATVVVTEGGGRGWAGTSDLTPAGLQDAVARARQWARASASQHVADLQAYVPQSGKGVWRQTASKPWQQTSVSDKIALLQAADTALNASDRIVDREAALWHTDVETLLVSTNGSDIEQRYEMLVPDLAATASDSNDTQLRTLGGRGVCRQGGLETLDDIQFLSRAPDIANDALILLDAPSCPTANMDLLLAPDQMVLQVHESIGHPLELDRILGDERNYAGTSFVTQDMFGSYQYGSDLLNVTFDPGVQAEFASYGFDADGSPAERAYIIEAGVLKRPLGAHLSQHRAGMAGVANSRASSWNRPPIDRMANLNVEPGDQSMAQLVAGIERGVLMRSNTSWSIDDSRNKFQFGCEWGQLIVDGQLTDVVKKPNYRGVSATFWRNLSGVGDASTWQLNGSPYCGKGEPNQCIRVGHATPMCKFSDIEVFGGAA